MSDTRHQPPERGELFRLDQEILGFLQMVQRCFGRIPGVAYFLFAAVQRRFGPLAFGDLFGRDIDADNFAARAAQRMPIGAPEPLLDLVRRAGRQPRCQ